jgi:hypothetical protein
MLADLQSTGQERVAIVIASDGLPTNTEGNESEVILSEFVRLWSRWRIFRYGSWWFGSARTRPRWKKLYYQLDGLLLELSMEVVDDFMGKAREVYQCNKWINYALPLLHRCRELGYHDRQFDLIDERTVVWGRKLREFCKVLFGERPDVVPDPATDWKAFVRYVEECLKVERMQWDPIAEKLAPWINLKALYKAYGKEKCSIM